MQLILPNSWYYFFFLVFILIFLLVLSFYHGCRNGKSTAKVSDKRELVTFSNPLDSTTILVQYPTNREIYNLTRGIENPAYLQPIL